ncbi:MAG: hypothetical protein WC479_00815 [Candidatus Izemoplasmatales bacterium]
MTRIANSQGTLNAYNITPEELTDRDRFGYKIVAVIRNGYWCAYRGLTDWSDEEVARSGDSVSHEIAAGLFPTLDNSLEWGD